MMGSSSADANADADGSSDLGSPDKPSLPRLLAALALGARSVNALPIAREGDADGDGGKGRAGRGGGGGGRDVRGDGDSDDDDDDEFAFRMSLPEFASLNREARREVADLLSTALDAISVDGDGGTEGGGGNDNDGDGAAKEYDFDDPELWERCADACDALCDRVSGYTSSREGGKAGEGGGELSALSTAASSASRQARNRATSAYGKMMSALADIEKPQSVHQGFVTHPPQNTRGEPFVPFVVYDAEKQAGIDRGEFTREGHGLETREGGNNSEQGDFTRRKYSPDMVAPSHHYDHPYRDGVEALEYRPWQLDVSGVRKAEGPIQVQCDENDDGVWIGAEENLEKLVRRIREGQKSGEIREIAVDLEAHSHRTFAGFVCLIQLSVRRPEGAPSDGEGKTTKQSAPLDVTTGYDFLIDALSLRHALPSLLGPLFSDPSLLKVMHGADSDVPWLQRDFGIYLVNLFDTGRAARALGFSSAGLAYLLRKYVGFEADKSHQLADWRRRPLPEDMRGYAVSDTRYLLDIYDQLRLELEEHPSPDVSLTSVLDRSKKVCLIRYDKDPFRPSGYATLMNGRNSRRRRGGKNEVASEWTTQQEAALKALWDWRDRTARQEDESVQYVCPNGALVRIAMNRPTTAEALRRLANPLPPPVMRGSREVLEAVRSAAAAVTEKGTGGKPEDALPEKARAAKPANPPSPARVREMLSPILGSEALYQKAGWTTPTVPDGSSGASESENDESPQKFLDVNAANKGFSSVKLSAHSIELSPPPLEEENNASREASADGLETARAALDGSVKASVHEDARVAQRSADAIRTGIAKLGEGGRFGGGFSLVDLIRPLPMPEGMDFAKGPDAKGEAEPADGAEPPEPAPEEDELTIPKSMREIYDLSNSNRRKAGREKAAVKPLTFPDDGVAVGAEKFDEDDVEGADAVIAARGGPGGYFGNSGGGGGGKRPRTSPGRDGDVKLMVKMGWVKGKTDAESLAATPGDPQAAAEKDRGSGHGPHHKKSGGGRGGGGSGSSGGGGSFDYYSNNMGVGIGAFDPNAAPSKNPFFA
ncbi:hypothetical protein ACHAWF_009400, partial [Thalassiosira exigua]